MELKCSPQDEPRRADRGHEPLAGGVGLDHRGGINEVGFLREFALQGVDALLVEKSDFCSGTSSVSTRIIHGGFRYREDREFGLVKESLWERNRLLKNAPHYVRPLPTTNPIFNWTAGLLSALGKFLGFKVPPIKRGRCYSK